MTPEERISRMIAEDEQRAAQNAAENVVRAATLRMLPQTLAAVEDARVIISNVRLGAAAGLINRPRAWISLKRDYGDYRRCVTEFARGLEADGWTAAPSCWASYGNYAGCVRPVVPAELPQVDDGENLRGCMPALPYWYELDNFVSELRMFLVAPDKEIYCVIIDDKGGPVRVVGNKATVPGSWRYVSAEVQYSRGPWGPSDCERLAMSEVTHKYVQEHGIRAQVVWKRLSDEAVGPSRFASWLERPL